MTIQEFEKWYNEKSKQYRGGHNWMQYKARHFISKSSFSFEEADELVSLTVEAILENLEKIDISTSLDGFFFIWMKNLFTNKFLHPRKKVCCEGDFTDYNIVQEDYDMQIEKDRVKMLNELNSRIETDEEKQVLNTLLTGGRLMDVKIDPTKRANIVRKIKGLPIKEKPKKPYKSKATGAKMGRKVTYDGVACIKDGKVFKMYPDLKSVKADDFTPDIVRRCLNGQAKSHKGFTWELVKNLENE